MPDTGERHQPRISGYAVCLDALTRGQPVTAAIEALRPLCFEVVVVDGGSRDGTWEHLERLAESRPWLRVQREEIDREHPRWAVTLRTSLASIARECCRGDYCWETTLDEVVADDAGPRVQALARHWPPGVDVIEVPSIEYWGTIDQLRIDVAAGRGCFSRNVACLTHGVPRELRRFDTSGELCVARHAPVAGALIDRDTYLEAIASSLLPPEAELLRRAAAAGDAAGRLARAHYQVAFNHLLEETPSVFQLRSLSLRRRLTAYRAYGAAEDASLFDSPELLESSPLGKPWREVSDAELDALAASLLQSGPSSRHASGGGPRIRCGKLPPAILESWLVHQLAEAGVEDPGAEDAGAEDAGAEDAGAEDAGAEDSRAEDAGVARPACVTTGSTR